MPRISTAFTVFKSFRTPVSLTLLLLLLVFLFVTLGTWQARRAVEKSATEQQHQLATSHSLDNAMAQNRRFSRIEVSGSYDTNRHILLDNQIWRGRGGVHVFTPFTTINGHTILVNRGWLPLAPARNAMPEIPTPGQDVILKGMLNTLPVPGRVLGSADRLKNDQWPQLVTYLNLADISTALEQPLENWVIQLSKSERHGFDGREWKPVFLSSSRHKGYAFQWFALAMACVVMWVIMGFRNSSGNDK